MSKHKHTPGPWKLFIDDTGGPNSGYPISIDADDEKNIVRTGGFHPYEWDEKLSKVEVVANARLIAAAPDMLELLEELVSILNHRSDVLTPSAWDDAMSVIAKAKGEKP